MNSSENVVRLRAGRPLGAIAWDVLQDPSYRGGDPTYAGLARHAHPYLMAMMSMQSLSDTVDGVSGVHAVDHLIFNLVGWRGETARRIKGELRDVRRTAR